MRVGAQTPHTQHGWTQRGKMDKKSKRIPSDLFNAAELISASCQSHIYTRVLKVSICTNS